MGSSSEGPQRKHPHTIAGWDIGGKGWDDNNTIYFGRGRKAKLADPALRLTKPGGPLSHWRVPHWLRDTELTYHQNTKRWLKDGTLHTVGRGQEFVANVREMSEPKKWLDEVIATIERDQMAHG
jgi:hypothetical protein